MDPLDEREHAAELPAAADADRARTRLAIAAGAMAVVAGVLLLLSLLVGFSAPSSSDAAERPDAVAGKAAPPEPGSSPKAVAYTFRSTVPGASLVRLGDLPRVTPYAGDWGDYCREQVRPATTAGGRLAERRGWSVVDERRFHGLDAVLVVRGYVPGLSAHCFSRDPNIAFFEGDRLIGILYARGRDRVGPNHIEYARDGDRIGINHIENIGPHLRVWDDLTAVGQFNLEGTRLSFDPVTGIDAFCDGRHRVPVLYHRPYSSARQRLVGSGWVARPSAEEVVKWDSRTWDLRGRFPEVDTCSGTGYAHCRFSLEAEDGTARLFITTTGEDDDPFVTGYDVSCDGQQDQ